MMYESNLGLTLLVYIMAVLYVHNNHKELIQGSNGTSILLLAALASFYIVNVAAAV